MIFVPENNSQQRFVTPIGLAVCQVTTGLGIEFIQPESEYRNDAYFRTTERPKYWSQLGSSKNRSIQQQEQGREVIAQLIKEVPHQVTICFTDGSCIKNPGPCGAGAVIYLSEDSLPATV